MDNSLLGVHLKELVTNHAVPGAQFAVYHGGETWTWTYGETRAGSGTPMTDDSPVPVGSITKVVTAAAALVLVGDDDLELDEPLVDVVPELRDLPRGLTLRHVLSHTGGLPCDPTDVRAVTSRRYVQDCCRTAESLADPGSIFSYSNIGYLLAGHAITTITGMSWWEAVQALVLDPAGVPARFVTGSRVPADLVTGHSGRGRPVVQALTAAQAATGALAASATDLVNLGRGLLTTVLDREAADQMCTPVPGADPFGLADGWGLGLATYGAGRTVGHDGNGDGTSCHLRMNRDTGTVVALTTNSGAGFVLWRELARRLPECGLPIDDYDPLAVSGRPIAAPDGCVGDYANGDLEYTVRHNVVGGFRLTVDDEPFADLTVHSGHRFTMRDTDTGVTDQAGRFVVEDGHVTGIQVGGRLARKQLERALLVG